MIIPSLARTFFWANLFNTKSECRPLHTQRHAGGGEDGLGPVRVLRPRDKQHLHRGRDLLGLAEQHEFGSAKTPGLGLLIPGGAEDDHLVAQLGRELDGQVAEPADADDTDPVPRLRVVDEGGVHRGAGALQRGRVLAGQGVGNLVHVALLADEVAAEGAVIVVALAELDAVVAKDVPAGQAVVAVPAAVAVEAGPGPVAGLEGGDLVADSLDDADALVAQGQGRTVGEVLVVRVADARVGYVDQDVSGAEGGDGHWCGGDFTPDTSVDVIGLSCQRRHVVVELMRMVDAEGRVDADACLLQVRQSPSCRGGSRGSVVTRTLKREASLYI